MCGGDHSTCKLVVGNFSETDVPIGYHRILEIPAGATSIQVKEMTRSPNYLGIGRGAWAWQRRLRSAPAAGHDCRGGAGVCVCKSRESLDSDLCLAGIPSFLLPSQSTNSV